MPSDPIAAGETRRHLGRDVWEEARHLAANYAKSKAYGSYWPTDEEVEQSGAYGELSEHSEIYIG